MKTILLTVDFKFNDRAIQVDKTGKVFDDEPPYQREGSR